MPEKAGLGALLAGIVDRPGSTLANVVAHPRWRWLFPVVLAIAAMVVYTLLAVPFLVIQMQQATAQIISGLPAAQAEAVQRVQTPAFVAASTVGVGLITMVTGWLIQAAVLYFGILVGGGDLQFGGVFAATPWLSVPFALEHLLQAAYIKITGQMVVNQGLSYFVSSGNIAQDQRNLQYVALGQATLFRLWHLVLVYALFRVAARFSRAAAFSLTAIYLLILLGGQLIMAALTRLVSPG